MPIAGVLERTEGTNVSLGRGTPHPFVWIGAPWANGHDLAHKFNQKSLPGVITRPVYFTPSRPPYEGQLVSGVHLHVVDATAVHSLKVGVALIQTFLSLYPKDFHINIKDDDTSHPFFDLLAGGHALRHAILSDTTDAYFEEEQKQCDTFTQQVTPYLLCS